MNERLISILSSVKNAMDLPGVKSYELRPESGGIEFLENVKSNIASDPSYKGIFAEIKLDHKGHYLFFEKLNSKGNENA